MTEKDPLLLLNNASLSDILADGDYRFANVEFEAAKAIIEMKGEDGVIQNFEDPVLEKVIFDYLGIDHYNFTRQTVSEMHVGQDALAFKLYITPSGTQPIVIGKNGQQARKVQNIYVYCQHIVRIK